LLNLLERRGKVLLNFPAWPGSQIPVFGVAGRVYIHQGDTSLPEMLRAAHP